MVSHQEMVRLKQEIKRGIKQGIKQGVKHVSLEVDRLKHRISEWAD